MKQGSCTQEGYVNLIQFSACEGQPDKGVHYIIMSSHPVANYSNMTHFNVGHIDEVSVCSNGDTGDGKLTRAWTNGRK